MKTKIKLRAAIKITFALFLCANLGYAQEEGQLVFSGGFGAAPVTKNIIVKPAFESSHTQSQDWFAYSYPNSSFNLTAIPALNAMVDFGITDESSIGLALSYQSWNERFDGNASVHYYSSYFDSSGQFVNSDTNEMHPQFKSKISRTNIALRGLKHFDIDDSDWDVFFGLRVGISLWHFSTTNTDARYQPDDPIFLFGSSNSTNPTEFSLTNIHFSPQLVLGTRYYFNEHWGITGELACGAPYCFSGGVALRW